MLLAMRGSFAADPRAFWKPFASKLSHRGRMLVLQKSVSRNGSVKTVWGHVSGDSICGWYHPW